MDQNSGSNRPADQGSEDASQAREHVQNAQENRDALAAQNRRVEATAPPEVRSDVDSGTRGGSGMNAAGSNHGGTTSNNDQGSEDNSAALEHVQNAAENRDALAAQNRRVEATAPEETRHDLRDNNNR
jgi:hypothetical protein